MLRQHADIGDVVHRGIMGGYGNDLIILLPAVDHLHIADHGGFHQAERLDGFAAHHQDIQGIIVISQGTWDEAIVNRVMEAGIDHAVKLKQAGPFVDLILAFASLWDLNQGVYSYRGIAALVGSMPGVKYIHTITIE
jgi:hypothetical protein